MGWIIEQKRTKNESVQNKSQQTEKEFFFIFHIKEMNNQRMIIYIQVQ